MTRLLLTASMFALAACGGTAAPSSAELCSKMIAGDAEIAEDMAQDSIVPDDFCACFGANLDALPEADVATRRSVVMAVTALRKGGSVDIETAAEALEDAIRSGTGGHTFTEDDFNNTGQMLDGVRRQLRDGGTCAAG